MIHTTATCAALPNAASIDVHTFVPSVACATAQYCLGYT
jgi:hypothetical protein